MLQSAMPTLKSHLKSLAGRQNAGLHKCVLIHGILRKSLAKYMCTGRNPILGDRLNNTSGCKEGQMVYHIRKAVKRITSMFDEEWEKAGIVHNEEDKRYLNFEFNPFGHLVLMLNILRKAGSILRFSHLWMEKSGFCNLQFHSNLLTGYLARIQTLCVPICTNAERTGRLNIMLHFFR